MENISIENKDFVCFTIKTMFRSGMNELLDLYEKIEEYNIENIENVKKLIFKRRSEMEKQLKELEKMGFVNKKEILEMIKKGVK